MKLRLSCYRVSPLPVKLGEEKDTNGFERLGAPNRLLTCLLVPRSVPGTDGRMFVKNTVVNIGSFHIASTQTIAVSVRKIKLKHIQKESTFPRPLIMSFRPPPGGLPLKTIQPLATPGHPRSVRLGSEDNKTRLYISITEVMSVLVKGAVETFSPAQSESGFYSVTSSSPRRMVV